MNQNCDYQAVISVPKPDANFQIFSTCFNHFFNILMTTENANTNLLLRVWKVCFGKSFLFEGNKYLPEWEEWLKSRLISARPLF